MQLAPVAAAPATKPPSSFLGDVPLEFQAAPIGTGTVASEANRAIRVRFEGSGPISQRTLVPESEAAIELFRTEHGATLDRAIRSFASVVDAHQGKENLRTVTLVPDEHASAGIAVVNLAQRLRDDGKPLDTMIEPDQANIDWNVQRTGVPAEQVRTELRSIGARQAVELVTKDHAAKVAFAGAWNGDGNIVVMPDVSRDLLTTMGLYRIQPGDQAQLLPRAAREQRAAGAWHAAVHEAHHSVTPMGDRGPEWTSVMEEAVPEVLTPADMRTALRRAGADLSRLALPARDTKHEPVDWPAWNRTHLPAPPTSQMATARGRYMDGPTLVRELLGLAGLDRRTTEGKATARDLLQGEHVSQVPRRLADAIVAEHGLAAERAPELTDLIQQAAIGTHTIADIERFVTGATAG